MGLPIVTKKKTNTSSGSSSGGSSSGAKSTTTSQASAPATNSTNYQALINDAVAKGDYTSAAKYEQQRNEKINAMNASGTNTGGYTTTNNYSQYTQPQSSAPSGFSGSATGVTAYNAQQSGWLDEMNANSKAWHTATPEEKAQLEARNQALAGMLGGSVTFDPNTGYWSGAAEAPVEVTDKPTFDEEYWRESQPTFSDNYAGISDELFNKILSREDFNYDPSKDPMYGYYQDMYRREGDRARENTLADVASSAGGMNSWAVTAAQQAQNNYNAKMTDMIPELKQLAYQMYLDDKASMVQDLGLVNQMSDRQYNRYMDQMGIWRDDRDFAYGTHRDDVGDWQWGTSFNYGVSQDQINNAWKGKEWEYGVSTDQYNREQAAQQDARAWALDLLASGATPDPATLQAAGLTLDQAKQILANNQASASRSSGGSSSSSSGGGGGGSSTSGMDLDGLFEEAKASKNPYVFMENTSNLKKYGVGKYSDNLVDAYEEWLEGQGSGGGGSTTTHKDVLGAAGSTISNATTAMMTAARFKPQVEGIINKKGKEAAESYINGLLSTGTISEDVAYKLAVETGIFE